ncbi:hypothetical protein COT94_04055 [Candidatus Falkowbacteria bacterium CG10_big_fil_rev_8_21_14_0_10_37_14]|uniref:SIMPL domain-containing protein n=1 Tax=Candidatus Falkowbacteria bacterium CG10_big_fil_rev_8_21_14_0_10_37_14 TaxID=1974561 RepID=A0A2M6WSE8_9BACT|nr:SIMPL domain-containing protein [Candidatus Falkowbacteria bacterium]PIT95733.1 MAG: hypothetical protein COT94_04055 [Candidatus Falkowbacteria bacterium CG10_big_fil_rev_8_21_14_0_10_37_14]
MNKTNFSLAVLLIIAVSTIVVTALWKSGQTNSEDRFSVVGSGTVYAKADIANLQVGFKTETKKTAAEATTDSSKKMNGITEVLKKLDIKTEDIKTTQYNLNPVYNWTDRAGQTLIGYEVLQSLTLKIRDLDKIGEVIARTTEQGANQVGGISFTIDDEFALRNQARELAIKKAKEKAELISKQSGMKLGAIKSVSENNNTYPAIMAYSNAKAMDSVGSGVESIPATEIQSGQNEIKVEVTLIYEVK